MPETRLSCWSQEEPRTTFWVASDEHCGARQATYRETRRTPACWDGVLTTPGGTFTTSHAHPSRQGHVIERVSWVDESGTVQQAADLVVEDRLRLDRAPGAHRDLLALHAIALQFWLHAAEPG